MRYFKLLLLLFFSVFSIYGTYIALYVTYLNHVTTVKNDVIEIHPGESINTVISKFTSNNLITKSFIKIFMLSKNIKSKYFYIYLDFNEKFQKINFYKK